MSIEIEKSGVILSHFIRQQETRVPKATGDLTTILTDLASTSKSVSEKIVRRAGLVGATGITESINVHGEYQQRIDILAHGNYDKDFEKNNHIAGAVSEEEKEIIIYPNSENKKYFLLLDPLDGSSNFDVDVSVGTIFAIYKKIDEGGKVTVEDFLQKGDNLICAGYFLYGSSTMFVYTTGNGVNGFTLDPVIGEYIHTHPNMTIPESGKYCSANYSYRKKWEQNIRDGVESLMENHSSRYIGSFVADFHRNLIKGGVFLYPADVEHPNGKLRLTYEAIPLAFLIEQAGGLATDGKNEILDIKPTDIHQRIPLIIGSKNDVELFF